MRDLNEHINPNQTARAKFKQRLAGGAVLLVVLAIFLPFIFNHSHMNNATLSDSSTSAPITATPEQVAAPTPTPSTAATAPTTVSHPDALQNTAVSANSMSSDQPGLTSPQSETNIDQNQPMAQTPSTPAAQPQAQAQTQPVNTATSQPEAAVPSSAPEMQTELPKPRATRVKAPAAAALPVAHHEAVAKVHPVDSGNWIIQAGSFSQPGSAHKLAAQLRAKGLPAYTQAQPNHFVRVYIGPFASQQQALKVQQQIHAEFQLSSLVSKKHV